MIKHGHVRYLEAEIFRYAAGFAVFMTFIFLPAFSLYAIVQEGITATGDGKSNPLFSVQAGVYSNQESAINDATNIGKRGINCAITKGKRLFKLFCGNPASMHGILSVMERLHELGYRDAFIFKLRSQAVLKKFEPSIGKERKDHWQKVSTGEPVESPPGDKHKHAGISDNSKENQEVVILDTSGDEDENIHASTVETDTVTLPDSMALPEDQTLMDKDIAVNTSLVHGSEDGGKDITDFLLYVSQDLFKSKKGIIIVSSVLLIVVTLIFFIVLIILRCIGAIQAIRARNVLKEYAGLFKDEEYNNKTIEDIGRRLRSIGNTLFIEQLIDKFTAQSERTDNIRALYDATGITDKYISILQRSKSWKKRAFACEKLGHIGSGKAVVPLLSIIRDVNNEDEDVRMVALRSLGRISDRRLSDLNKTRPGVREVLLRLARFNLWAGRKKESLQYIDILLAMDADDADALKLKRQAGALYSYELFAGYSHLNINDSVDGNDTFAGVRYEPRDGFALYGQVDYLNRFSENDTRLLLGGYFKLMKNLDVETEISVTPDADVYPRYTGLAEFSSPVFLPLVLFARVNISGYPEAEVTGISVAGELYTFRNLSFLIRYTHSMVEFDGGSDSSDNSWLFKLTRYISDNDKVYFYYSEGDESFRISTIDLIGDIDSKSYGAGAEFFVTPQIGIAPTFEFQDREGGVEYLQFGLEIMYRI